MAAPGVVARLPAAGGWELAEVRDLSASGLYLFSRATLPAGAELELQLRHRGGGFESEWVALQGRIVRLEAPRTPGSAPGMAIEMIGKDASAAFGLLDLVERHEQALRSRAAAGDRARSRRYEARRRRDPVEGSTTDELSRRLREAVDALAALRVEAERASELDARVQELERELEQLREHELVPPEREPKDAAVSAVPAAGGTGRTLEPRDVTLGPETVRSLEDLVGRLERGARLRPTPRFRSLQPVSREDIRLCDLLRHAESLEQLEKIAGGQGLDHELVSLGVYRFFQRGLVRITR